MAIIKSEYKIIYDKGQTETIFRAKLKYPKDLSTNVKNDIRSRIDYDESEDYDERYYFGKKDLGTYLVDNGFFPRIKRKLNSETKIINFYKFLKNYNDRIEFLFSHSFDKLNLNVFAKAIGEVPREEIIDLEELDSFIKKGDYSYKKGWNNSKFKKR